MSRSVWFVVEHDEGQVNRGAAELAAAARSLGAEAVAVVCAGLESTVPAQIAAFADRVVSVRSAALEEYSADGWAHAIVELASARRPDAILLPHAPLGRELGPILAARLETGMLSDCVALEWSEGLVGTRSVYRRKLIARERVGGEAPAIATVQRGAFSAAEPGEAAVVEDVAVAMEGVSIRTRLLARESAGQGAEDITEAEIVVAGGRGLGDEEKFGMIKELADALGGAMGASRPVVDQGWAPHHLQIGSSGVTVRPKLYFAIGVSGAVQHIVGMRESDVIVAINKDGQAPIFEYAHYGIVDDLFKVLPALLAAVKA